MSRSWPPGYCARLIVSRLCESCVDVLHSTPATFVQTLFLFLCAGWLSMQKPKEQPAVAKVCEIGSPF